MGFEIAALAAVVVKVVLPYVAQGAEKLASSLADRVGEAAADGSANVAGRIWNRVRSALTASGDEDVVKQVEKRPEASAALLETVLTERLEQDSQLREDLQALVNQEISAGRDVVQIFGHGGVVNAGDVSGGIVAGNIEHLEHAPAPPPPTRGPRE
jgi:hypothetical protein